MSNGHDLVTVKKEKLRDGLYSGQLLNGGPCGRGKMKFSDGGWYDGMWHKGRWHGNGRLQYSSGSVYHGQWCKGYKHGFGSYKNVGGDSYIGRYRYGKKHGRGSYVYACGDAYTGPFYKDMKHGNGQYVFANGDVFEGVFVNNMAEGSGTYYYNDGRRYEGVWCKDERHGVGSLYLMGDRVFKVYYVHGRIRKGTKTSLERALDADRRRRLGEDVESDEDETLTSIGSVYDESGMVDELKQLTSVMKTQRTRMAKSRGRASSMSDMPEESAVVPRSQAEQAKVYKSLSQKTDFLLSDRPSPLQTTTTQKNHPVEKATTPTNTRVTNAIQAMNARMDKMMAMQARDASLSITPAVRVPHQSTISNDGDDGDGDTIEKSKPSPEKKKKSKKKVVTMSPTTLVPTSEESTPVSSVVPTETRDDMAAYAPKPRNESPEQPASLGRKSGKKAKSKFKRARNTVSKPKPMSPLRSMTFTAPRGGGNGMNLRDYESVGILGQGAFGEVRLVRLRSTERLYAMKVMRKLPIVQKNQEHHVMGERDALAALDSEWIVKLQYAFQDGTNLYLVMEFVVGGNFQHLLDAKEILPEHAVRQYIAEIAVAVDLVHSAGFVHRDLKPDNLLLDVRGHVKLTDFGFTQRADSDRSSSDNKLSETVGTVDYIAPEVFGKGSYGQQVDWWAVGVIMYECLVGNPPFVGRNEKQAIQRIKKHKKSLEIPNSVSTEAADVIRGLICDVNTRMSFEDLREMPFFQVINWSELRSGLGPYGKGESSDTSSNFPHYKSAPPEIEVNPLARDHSKAFRRFDFNRDDNTV